VGNAVSIDPISSLKEDLGLINLKPNRLKGQNFLISPKTRDRIVDQADLSADSSVLEIGPGTGILTWAILKVTQQLTSIEIEKILADHLKERFNMYAGFKVIQGDALDVLRDDLTSSPRKIVANLPYSISSPVLLTMASRPTQYPEGVLLLQKEVVERVVAEPGDKARSALSVLVQFSFDSNKAFNVKASQFYPKPKVDSAVVRLRSKLINEDVSWECFKKTVYLCFSQRRKTIFNNLRSRWNSEYVSHILQKAGVDYGLRPQDLHQEAFYKIASLTLNSEQDN